MSSSDTSRVVVDGNQDIAFGRMPSVLSKLAVRRWPVTQRIDVMQRR